MCHADLAWHNILADMLVLAQMDMAVTLTHEDGTPVAQAS